MQTSRLLDAERTLALVGERGLPLLVLACDEHTRGTLVDMLVDPDNNHGPEYYQGASDMCAQILRALRADEHPNQRTSMLIVNFGLLQCMADCGVQLTTQPKPES